MWPIVVEMTLLHPLILIECKKNLEKSALAFYVDDAIPRTHNGKYVLHRIYTYRLTFIAKPLYTMCNRIYNVKLQKVEGINLVFFRSLLY